MMDLDWVSYILLNRIWIEFDNLGLNYLKTFNSVSGPVA